MSDAAQHLNLHKYRGRESWGVGGGGGQVDSLGIEIQGLEAKGVGGTGAALEVEAAGGGATNVAAPRPRIGSSSYHVQAAQVWRTTSGRHERPNMISELPGAAFRRMLLHWPIK